MGRPILNNVRLEARPKTVMGRSISYKRNENVVVNRSISPLNHYKSNQITEFITNMRDYIGRSENFVVDYLPKRKKEVQEDFDFLAEEEKYISTHNQNAYDNSERTALELGRERKEKLAREQGMKRMSKAKARKYYEQRQRDREEGHKHQEVFLSKLILTVESAVKSILEKRKRSAKRKKDQIDLQLISSESLNDTKELKVHMEHIRELLKAKWLSTDKALPREESEEEESTQSFIEGESPTRERKKSERNRNFLFSDWEVLKKKWSLNSDRKVEEILRKKVFKAKLVEEQKRNALIRNQFYSGESKKDDDQDSASHSASEIRKEPKRVRLDDKEREKEKEREKDKPFQVKLRSPEPAEVQFVFPSTHREYSNKFKVSTGLSLRV